MSAHTHAVNPRTGREAGLYPAVFPVSNRIQIGM